MFITRSTETKENKTWITHYEANQAVAAFIEDIKDNLEMLKEESFQRHVPEYFDEVEYYNNFHQRMPQNLVLSDCYKTFVKLYWIEGKSLFEAVSGFIDTYENPKSN